MKSNWRKSSYSTAQGNCVQVGGDCGRVLVQDTKDRAGPVLRFSPAAWRRFADQVKRSLLACSSARTGAALPCEGWPLCFVAGGMAGFRGLFPRRAGGSSARISARLVCWFPSVPGSAWYWSRLWPRSVPSGGGRRERVRGNRETGLWGFPGSPGACSFLQPKGAVWYARRSGQSSSVICAVSLLCRGGRNGGLGENLDCDTRSHVVSELVKEVWQMPGT
jgi:hypothetical protein